MNLIRQPLKRSAGTILLSTILLMTISGYQNEAYSQDEEADPKDASYFEITTPEGRMVVRLYDETPIHRDNFRKLVADGFYDGTTFHRVIPGFMIQGGDPNSKDGDPATDGMGGPGYTQAAEFNPKLYHKKGALAAARTGGPMNPEKESSGSQFYIVVGQVVENDFLDKLETYQQSNLSAEYRVQDEARESYTTIGGAPNLDMDYTVFGELVEGFDVMDKIAQVEKSPRDRPVTDVTMTIKPLLDYSPE